MLDWLISSAALPSWLLTDAYL